MQQTVSVGLRRGQWQCNSCKQRIASRVASLHIAFVPFFLEPFPKSNLVLNWEMSWKEWIDKMLQNHRHHQIVLMQGRIDAADCKRAMTMQLLPTTAEEELPNPIILLGRLQMFCRWQLMLVLQYIYSDNAIGCSAKQELPLHTLAQASKGGLLMESMQWLSCPPRLKNKFASLQACLKLRPTNRVNSVDLQVKLKSYKFYHWADFNIGVNSLRYSWKVNKFNWLNQGFLLTPKFSRYVMQSMLGNRKLIQIAQTTSHGQWQRKKNCSVATVAHFDQIWASLKKTPVTVL